MTRARSITTCLLAFTAVLAPGLVLYAAEPGKPDPKVAKAQYARDILPVVAKYCSACHGAKQHQAGIDFTQYPDEAAMVKGRAVWEKAAHAIVTGKMPPKRMPQPSAAERSLLAGWVDAKLTAVDCDLRDPGRVTLRRLNRAEYNNTIRDLLGVSFRPADDFPSDDVGYGFDNIGDVLTISPLLMEKYLNAAEQVTEKAIVSDELSGPSERVEAESLSDQAGGTFYENNYRLLGVTGDFLQRRFLFEKDGEYLLRVRAFGQQAGPDPVKMGFRMEGQDIGTVEVRATEENPKVYQLRLPVGNGRKLWSVVFLNNYKTATEDRNLVIDWLEVIGPVKPRPEALPESHRHLIPAPPEEGKEIESARKVLGEVARRAFRRPVTEEELDRLLGIVRAALKDGESFERGIQLGLQAVLVSPHFLFRVELDPNPKDSASIRPLNDYELASRLSYFLWSSMPDDELSALAADGTLGKPEVLEAQVRRMLRDPKSSALVENFAGQWLTLRLLRTASPDPKRFPTFNEALRRDMQRETELFFDCIMREDRNLTDLIDGKFTFLNERLARHYGIDWVKGDHFRKVVLTGDQRGGVLTQASVLTVTSNPTRTSPVKRGKWVLEQLLGTPPPPPPPNVPLLKDDQAGEMLTGTLRQRMEQHRKDPVCANCHEGMDAIGFALENYDPVGAWREKDGGAIIDPSGKLPTGASFAGAEGFKKVLRKEKTAFIRNFTERLLTYALGRGTERYDRCAIDEAANSVLKSGGRFSAAVLAVVRSDPFRMRRGDSS